MLQIQVKLEVSEKNIHTYFIRRYIVQLWENYITTYASHKENGLETEHIYIAYNVLDGALLFAYFFPDKIVENIGLNNIRDIMPWWSTYCFIAEEEKYRLEEMIKNNET